MSFLLIANFFSFISAIFTILASWTKSPKRTYAYQIGQCLVYAVAAYFFGVYATIAVMMISAFRNYLVYACKYTRIWMYICAIASLILGLIVNHGSIPGYIAVTAAVSYAVLSYYLTEPKAVKLNVIINLTLWLSSDILLYDIPSGIIDIVGITLAVITIFRIKKSELKDL